MKIAVTPQAAALIRRCGNRLYVWESPAGSTFACSAGAAPGGIEFQLNRRGDLELYVDRSLRVPGGIEVTLKRLPRTRLVAAPLGGRA